MDKEKSRIDIKYVSVELLKPAVYNPRKISPESLKQLKESISRFGTIDPIIVNGSDQRLNVVIGGHMRLKAVKELGQAEIPVVYVDIPDLEKEKELNLRLNKNTGEWDLKLLKGFDPNFLTDIGFSNIELGDIWKDEEIKEEDFDETEELAKIKVPKTKLGDLIILGKHKLLCGDTTDFISMQNLFGEERADMIMSDPPYNLRGGVDYTKGVGGKANYGGFVNDDRTPEEYRDFLKKSMINGLSVTKKDSHIFYWCDQAQIGTVQSLYHELNIKNKRVCLWIKNSQNPTPGVAFSKCYEPCVYGVRGKPKITSGINDLNEIMNKNISTGNNLHDEIRDIWLTKRLPGNKMEHATSKPPELYEKAIKRCTKPGDIILDSFLGSGSTLIAAQGLNRRVYGTELEPVFCDLIIRRFEKLTGIKAKIIRKGHEENNSSEKDTGGASRSADCRPCL
jgi:DNA modification methylase